MLKEISKELSRITRKKVLKEDDVQVLTNIRNNLSDYLRKVNVCPVCNKVSPSIANIRIAGNNFRGCEECSVAWLKNNTWQTAKPSSTPKKKSKSADTKTAVKKKVKTKPAKNIISNAVQDKTDISVNKKIVKNPVSQKNKSKKNTGRKTDKSDFNPAKISKRTGLSQTIVKKLYKDTKEFHLSSINAQADFLKSEFPKVKENQIVDFLKFIEKENIVSFK